MHLFRKHWLGWFLAFDIVLALFLFNLYPAGQHLLKNNFVTKIINDAEKVKNDALQITGDTAEKSSVQIDAPQILQKPELPRGCEVTALAMLLQNAGVQVSKMELASKIHKVPYYQNGYYGDPNVGFVGTMYSFSEQGYGVYHKPLANLGQDFLPGKIIDLSGKSFDAVLRQLQNGIPVVVITNATFEPLPQNAFQVWQTKEGKVKVTNQEHSVLVTGYDKDHIVFNDPLGKKNTVVDRTAFIKAWQQMGSQAISYRHSFFE
ncbi:C39 family peptidase [Sporolactobacillus kofuensis]|uniref:C39 family peptidase n=1 Tax=Sporolactobacillus kofuensis TaxID=269672 RepID=A0ABW1WJ15_9BACL|nr:C39 family peptidase [Sporolactobacillus kofuensis]MCO7176430.1 C39 family peptidase [Sporolactobacillus kofuensis]